MMAVGLSGRGVGGFYFLNNKVADLLKHILKDVENPEDVPYQNVIVERRSSFQLTQVSSCSTG